MKPTIVTMGQGSAQQYDPEPRTLCISIRTSGTPTANLRTGFVGVLFLDIDERPHGMKGWHANQLAEFLKKHEGQYDTLLIHCVVGASRSVSMAMALKSIGLGEYDEPRLLGRPTNEVPNLDVYSMTRRAMGARDE